jgi:hypothetical protein
MATNQTEQVTVQTPTPAGLVETRTTRRSISFSDFFVSKVNQVIFALIGIVDLLLLLRIAFLLLGANQVGVVSFLLDLTQIFVAPFVGIFPSPSAGSAYLDMAAVVAIVIYMIAGVILGVIIELFSSSTE